MVSPYRLKPLGFRLAAGAHVIPAAEFAAVETAEQLVLAAEARAASIVAAAEAAYEAEKARGFAEGLAAAGREAAGRLLAEGRVLERALAGLEGELCQLVVRAVRQLVEGFDPGTRTEAVVRFALQEMRRQKRAEIRLAPALLAEFRPRVEAIRAEFPDLDLIDLVEDASLGPADVVVETPVGRVEADFADRLAALEEAIRTAHAEPAAPDLLAEPAMPPLREGQITQGQGPAGAAVATGLPAADEAGLDNVAAEPDEDGTFEDEDEEDEDDDEWEESDPEDEDWDDDFDDEDEDDEEDED